MVGRQPRLKEMAPSLVPQQSVAGLPRNEFPLALPHSCHHHVSVLEGTRHTTVAPSNDERYAFAIQSPTSLPYGGFIQHFPRHSCSSPSTSGEKNAGHLAFVAVAQTSSSKPNSPSSSRNNSAGVAQSPRWEVNRPLLSRFRSGACWDRFGSLGFCPYRFVACSVIITHFLAFFAGGSGDGTANKFHRCRVYRLRRLRPFWWRTIFPRRTFESPAGKTFHKIGCGGPARCVH